MLNVYIITPFPLMLEPILNSSMFQKALDREIVKYNIINLFDFLEGDNERIDDYPFGGGDGMIMKPKPIFSAFESINEENSRVIFPTPDGQLFNHNIAKKLSKEKSLVFICGHYKGIDQRIRESIVTDELSIGDYVLTNGELPSLLMIDSIIRLIPGVLNTFESAKGDSFYNELLDGPHYTRPREINGLKVPEILLSGNHEKIKDWFLKKRIDKTKIRRKDLLNNESDNGE